MTYEEMVTNRYHFVMNKLLKDKTFDPLQYHVPPKEDFTCNNCCEVNECTVAWDTYNTGGDCLMNK